MFSEQNSITHDKPNTIKFYSIINPNQLKYEIPALPSQLALVNSTRKAISNVLSGIDDRLVVVVGSCSKYNYEQALEYARLLSQVAEKHIKELCILMQTSFQNPSTKVGGKEFVNSPQINDPIDINLSLKINRKLLIDIVNLGLPVATELPNLYSHQFIGDLISWTSIEARTTESQCHREMVSGLSFPVGFNSAINCDINVAVEAIVAAMAPHAFMSINAEGQAAIVKTLGNNDVHIVMRYGQKSNFSSNDFDQAYKVLEKVGIDPIMMVDVSNTKSRKDYLNQIVVAQEIAKQISMGERRIIGMMIKGNLNEGSQDLKDGHSLEYGVSILDKYISFDETIAIFEELAKAVTQRRFA